MADISGTIITWLKTLKGWQTELAYRILNQDSISSTDYAEILEMLKNGTTYTDKPFSNIGNSSPEGDEKVALLSIEAIKDIEKLAPKNPISFGDKNMIIVYGNNGSGKSGITRILKKICGKSNAKILKSNIYKKGSSIGECKIKYAKGSVEHEYTWKANDAAVEDLSSVDIYDTDTGTSYIKESKCTTYTPPTISLFESLSHSYSHLGQLLGQEKSRLIKTLPPLPTVYNSTQAARLYNGLTLNHTASNLSYIQWNEEKENTLQSLTERLNLKDPSVAAKEKRANKTETEKILQQLENASSKTSTAFYEELKKLNLEAVGKRRIATESLRAFEEHVKLEGIGTETWRALWEAARQYSETTAYVTSSFPNINENSKCVLCQQPLGEEAKLRLTTFSSFVEGTLEAAAKSAERKVSEVLNSLPESINETDLQTKCHAAGLDDDWFLQLKDVWSHITKVSGEMKSLPDTLSDISSITGIAISALKAHIERLEKDAIQLDEDANKFDRTQATKERLELEAIKWCSDEYENILLEVERLKKINKYDEWISQTNTSSVSRKASQIAEAVITEDYVKRFNEELIKLGASKIQAEIVKQNIARGVPYHSIRLKGVDNSHAPADIFSEGEFRIISLAAFLADVTGGNACNPFIFDDPISSLDQDFEEATVARLIELSKDRQVIVFTHRLSLLGLLHEKCDKLEPKVPVSIVGIRSETWGTGEPGELPFYGNPKTEFNKIKDQKLLNAKRVHESEGYDAYYPFAKAICSDFRNMIERTIENVLLADVIARHRRAVMTQGKIKNLAKISSADCILMEELMTKYSRYEHSQPLESPVQMPEPSEIETDLNRVLGWLNEFKNRQVSVPSEA